MSLLAIDTSTLTAGVGLRDREQLIVRRGRVTSHSDALLEMVRDVLADAKQTMRDVTGVVCGAGPGSFTGLRIGLATCKGLALSVDAPLLLLSSLAALAARAPDGPCLAILDAHKDEVYVATYDVVGGVPTLRVPERAIAPAALCAELVSAGPFALVGDGVLRYPELRALGTLVDDDGAPHPRELLRLGAAALARGERSSLESATPNYIRKSEAEIMKEKRERS